MSITSHHVVGDVFTMEQEPCGCELARDSARQRRGETVMSNRPIASKLAQFRHTQRRRIPVDEPLNMSRARGSLRL